MMKTALTIPVAVLLLCCLGPHSSAVPVNSDPGSGANVPGNPPMQTYPIVLQINLVPDVKGAPGNATCQLSSEQIDFFMKFSLELPAYVMIGGHKFKLNVGMPSAAPPPTV